LRSSRSTSTPGSARASARAIAGVSSVLALSAMTIRHVNGKPSERKLCSLRIEVASARSSL
jgi:hypothetical protein